MPYSPPRTYDIARLFFGESLQDSIPVGAAAFKLLELAIPMTEYFATHPRLRESADGLSERAGNYRALLPQTEADFPRFVPAAYIPCLREIAENCLNHFNAAEPNWAAYSGFADWCEFVADQAAKGPHSRPLIKRDFERWIRRGGGSAAAQNRAFHARFKRQQREKKLLWRAFYRLVGSEAPAPPAPAPPVLPQNWQPVGRAPRAAPKPASAPLRHAGSLPLALPGADVPGPKAPRFVYTGKPRTKERPSTALGRFLKSLDWLLPKWIYYPLMTISIGGFVLSMIGILLLWLGVIRP